MKGKDIIVMGLQSWDIGIGSNCINIAREFAKNNRVLYVNRALDRKSMLLNKKDPKTLNRLKSIRGETDDLTKVEDNLWVYNPRILLESINWMPSFLFKYFNKKNNRKLAIAIQDVSVRLSFTSNILFVDNDFFRAQYLKELLKPRFFIYYIRDYLIEQTYFKKHGRQMEKAIIEKADLVVTNSPYLARYAEQYSTASEFIGQGCDFTHFNRSISYSQPVDMNGIAGPVIGYVGALVSYRLDIELLESLAQKWKNWNWVFVGPEDPVFENSVLHTLSNVYFLGKKHESELASYISHFDICINPQLNNESTIGNYPRKIDEYLALGKFVVATHTEFMNIFSDFVSLCNGVNEYEEAIQRILAEKDDQSLIERKIEFALSHTWENSVNKIYQLYNQKLHLK